MINGMRNEFEDNVRISLLENDMDSVAKEVNGLRTEVGNGLSSIRIDMNVGFEKFAAQINKASAAPMKALVVFFSSLCLVVIAAALAVVFKAR